MFLQGVQSAVSVSEYRMESLEIAGVETNLLCLDPLWIFTPFLDPDL